MKKRMITARAYESGRPFSFTTIITMVNENYGNMPKKPNPRTGSGNWPVRYLGIDPGKSGGLAVVEEGKVVAWYLMPASDLDLRNVVTECITDHCVQFCSLEQVNSLPGEGHKGAFTFGMGFGKLQMVLACTGLSYEFVTPRTWQKALGIKARDTKKESKPAFKDRLRITTQKLFPKVPLWSEPKTLGKQRAVCDAILIAEFCRRKREGLLT